MWRIWIRRQVRVRMKHRCIGRIKEKLGIQVVRMEYKPEDMILQRYVIDEAQKELRYFMNIRER